MHIHDVMTLGVECIPPTATIQEAARKMRDLDVGSLPICDKNRLVGMLTDRDIATRALADGQDPRKAPVRECMTPDVIWCFEDQDVTEACDLMKENQIRRLAVLNRDKQLVGIVSLGDLACETHDEELAGATLEAVSEPAEPRR